MQSKSTIEIDCSMIFEKKLHKMVLLTSKNQTIEIFFGTTKQYHAMENHTMEIHVSQGLTIIVLKKLSDLK